jgi:hypothetical protein
MMVGKLLTLLKVLAFRSFQSSHVTKHKKRGQGFPPTFMGKGNGISAPLNIIKGIPRRRVEVN